MVAEPNDPPDVAATAGGELGAAVQEEIEIPVAQTPPTLEERVVILEQRVLADDARGVQDATEMTIFASKNVEEHEKIKEGLEVVRNKFQKKSTKTTDTPKNKTTLRRNWRKSSVSLRRR